MFFPERLKGATSTGEVSDKICPKQSHLGAATERSLQALCKCRWPHGAIRGDLLLHSPSACVSISWKRM